MWQGAQYKKHLKNSRHNRCRGDRRMIRPSFTSHPLLIDVAKAPVRCARLRTLMTGPGSLARVLLASVV